MSSNNKVYVIKLNANTSDVLGQLMKHLWAMMYDRSRPSVVDNATRMSLQRVGNRCYNEMLTNEKKNS